MNDEEIPVVPVEPETTEVPQEPAIEEQPFDYSTAVDYTVPLTDNELFVLMSVTLDDIKMLLVTFLMLYIIFKIVRW